MNRRALLYNLAGGFAYGQQQQQQQQEQKQPNVLLILFDKCRTDAIGAYGDRQGVATPHIDGLARDGVLFSNAFTPAALCGPARASMLTGRYPHSHGLRRNVYAEPRGRMNTNYPDAIADPFRDPRFALWDNAPFLLNNSGYATGCVGKWHLGPGNPGFFDYFKGFNSLLRHWVGEPHKSRYRPDVHTDDAIAFMEQNQRRPWFLYQSYYAPHEPLDPPKEWMAKFAGQEHAEYYATVAHLDHCVGRMIEALRRLGSFENTLILVTSDHGRTWIDRPGSLENIALAYDEVSRVPLVMRGPGAMGGRTWKGGVTTADIMPTILEAAGVTHQVGPADARLTTPLQSVSLFATLRTGGGGESWPRPVILQNIPQKGIDGSYFDERAIRTARHKLILRRFDARPELRPGELYDLAADPGETRNLYLAEGSVRARLGLDLAAWGEAHDDRLSVELGRFAAGR